MIEFRQVTRDGITYQVRTDRPAPDWAKEPEPKPEPEQEPKAKEATSPANKARRSPRSKQVSADA